MDALFKLTPKFKVNFSKFERSLRRNGELIKIYELTLDGKLKEEEMIFNG